MCGLAGWVDFGRNVAGETAILDRMSDTLSRRGPDASGIYTEGCAALVHRRLIVIDPAGGAQPMTEEYRGESYTIVYNGELYNALELRAELKALGFVFKSGSDTEVLLKAYEAWKSGCLEKLNGIYAFAVWEKRSERLFAARDRAGVKPFFFFQYGNGLVFGSEIKTLMASGLVKPVVDREGLYSMLLLGPGRAGGLGCVKGVKELFPGEYLVFDKSGLKRTYYWRLKAEPHTDGLEETAEKTRFLIEDAITRQLVSDVPLACFLSGGLDSSIITSVAAEKYREKGEALATYSVDYEDNEKYFVGNSFQPSADGKYIQIMSESAKSDHTRVCLNNLDVARSLAEAADARDLPGMADIDSSLLLFCREIKKSYTVCVSGECADEIFGGYPWYHDRAVLFADRFPWSGASELRKKLFAPAVGGDADDFMADEYRRTLKFADHLPNENADDRRMREMFAMNYYGFMQTLLDRKDRMSMYCGLEVRVPFCDHRLAEYAYNMPWSVKSAGEREKGIVRKAFEGRLPDEIVKRRKSPYPKTFHPAYFETVAKEAERLINDKKSVLNSLIDKKVFDELRADPSGMQTPWYGQLMRVPQVCGFLIQLNRVFEKFGLQTEI